MSGYYDDELIENIRINNEIVSVIAEYTKLDRKGKNYFGLCPFHKEKTPSFSVEPLKQIYYCFGCGKGGNVIHFVMAAENLDFPEALRFLAERANISIPEKDGAEELEKAKLRKELLDINKEAAKYYHQILNSPIGSVGKEYLAARGISEKTARHFGLGYSPVKGEGIAGHLGTTEHRKGLMLKSGLVSVGKDGNFYDRFKGRIIFPIIDLRGNVIGFGGRVIDKSLPKYVNSPETSVYSKSRNLYALNFAKNSKENAIIVVEGYLDVISLHQSGIINSVASLGTALTEGQGKLLKKYTGDVVIAFDSDSAGQAATLRSLDMLDRIGLDVKVLQIPEGKDPDEYIRKNGSARFGKLVRESISLVEYKIRAFSAQIDTGSTEGGIKLIIRLAEVLSKLDSRVETEMYAKKIAKDFNISEEAILSEISKLSRKSDRLRSVKTGSTVAVKDGNNAGRITYKRHNEWMIIALLCMENGIYGQIKEKIASGDFDDENSRKIAEIIFKRLDNNIEVTLGELLSMLDAPDAEEITKIVEKECCFEDSGKAAKAAMDLIGAIRQDHTDKRYGELMNMLADDKNLLSEKRRQILSELDTILRGRNKK